MSATNLFKVIQNVPISTLALHSFALGYYKVAKHKPSKSTYPKLEYFFYVLPIVYNSAAKKTFCSSRQLHTAIMGNKSIILGLQERANKMSSQTFDGLNLAFSKNILDYNSDNKTIEIKRGFKDKKIILPLSMKDLNHSVKMTQDSAHKLGAIFAKTDEKVLQVNLNIQF